jgi:hypothetical protein
LCGFAKDLCSEFAIAFFKKRKRLESFIKLSFAVEGIAYVNFLNTFNAFVHLRILNTRALVIICASQKRGDKQSHQNLLRKL